MANPSIVIHTEFCMGGPVPTIEDAGGGGDKGLMGALTCNLQ